MMTHSPVDTTMTFGPFPEGHCLHIRQHRAYETMKSNIPIADFLLVRSEDGKHPTLWVVETLSDMSGMEQPHNVDEFVALIREKFTNGLSFGIATCLNRHTVKGEKLPAAFKELDLARLAIRFVLVVRGHKEDWLLPLQDAIRTDLYAISQTWALPVTSVAVINDTMARDCGLIAASDAGEE